MLYVYKLLLPAPTYEVMTASSVAQARECCSRARFDIILMDVVCSSELSQCSHACVLIIYSVCGRGAASP